MRNWHSGILSLFERAARLTMRYLNLNTCICVSKNVHLNAAQDGVGDYKYHPCLCPLSSALCLCHGCMLLSCLSVGGFAEQHTHAILLISFAGLCGGVAVFVYALGHNVYI